MNIMMQPSMSDVIDILAPITGTLLWTRFDYSDDTGSGSFDLF
jgi:hypothetical protein